MTKKETTVQLGYRVDKNTKEDFVKLCEQKLMHPQKVFEKIMKDWISSNKSEVDI